MMLSRNPFCAGLRPELRTFISAPPPRCLFARGALSRTSVLLPPQLGRNLREWQTVGLQFVKGADGWAVIGDDFFVLADTKKEALQKYKEAVAASAANESASSESDDQD